jgi:hypothetical protein
MIERFSTDFINCHDRKRAGRHIEGLIVAADPAIAVSLHGHVL